MPRLQLKKPSAAQEGIHPDKPQERSKVRVGISTPPTRTIRSNGQPLTNQLTQDCNSTISRILGIMGDRNEPRCLLMYDAQDALAVALAKHIVANGASHRANRTLRLSFVPTFVLRPVNKSIELISHANVQVTVRATSTYIDETGTRSPNYKFVIGQS